MRAERRAQDLFVGDHARANGCVGRFRAALELRARVFVAVTLEGDPAGGRERQSGRKRHPGNG